MRITEATILADRIVSINRWLTLIGLSVFLAWGKKFGLAAILLLSLTALWNLALSIYTLANQRLPNHSMAVIGVDGLLAALFFILTGTQDSPTFWAFLLPLFSASFYYGIQGGLIAAAAMALFEFITLLFRIPILAALTAVGFPAVVMFIVALLVGSAATYFGRQLRQRRADEVNRIQEAERVERERINAIYAITNQLGATLVHQKVLDMALDLSANALSTSAREAAQLVSAFYLFEGDKMHVGSARRFQPGDMKAFIFGKEGVIAKSLQLGESRFISSPSSDPEISRIVALRECASVFIYPLRTSHEIFGMLIFGHPDPEYFTRKRREILEIVGRQALVALQNARLYRELLEEQERMVEIQEEARKKLARNLHDGPTQSVAALAMRVNFARRLMEKDAKAANEELYKIEDLARRTTKEIRHMLFTLRPLVLESSGLVAALESMAQKMGDTYEQNVTVEAEGTIAEQLDMGKQGVLFYIAEEAVNNARKHAEAEQVWVRVKQVEKDIALLEVQDNGVGFSVGAVDSGYEHRGSLGLVNMRERAELLNGLIKLESAPGKGTRIRVWVPLNEDAAARLRHG
jgi:signal transduction histidine kinase